MTFSAGTVPQVSPELQTLVDLLWKKLQEIEDEQPLRIEETHVAPENPQENDLVYADGTNWNPGSGRGLYRFNASSAWELI